MTQQHPREHLRETERDTITLYGQEADVHTERVESGQVRLRKRIVEEEVSVPVRLRREELDVIEEKAGVVESDVARGVEHGHVTSTGERAARADVRDLGDGELEITLYAERPVVTTEVVAVERVRVRKGVVTETREVTVELQHEEAYVEEEPNEHLEPRHDGQGHPRH